MAAARSDAAPSDYVDAFVFVALAATTACMRECTHDAAADSDDVPDVMPATVHAHALDMLLTTQAFIREEMSAQFAHDRSDAMRQKIVEATAALAQTFRDAARFLNTLTVRDGQTQGLCARPASHPAPDAWLRERMRELELQEE